MSLLLLCVLCLRVYWCWEGCVVYGTTTRAQVHSSYIFSIVSVCLQCTIDASARFKVFRIYFPTHCAQTCHSRRFTSSDKLNSLCLTINKNCLLYAYYLSVLHILVLGVSIVIHSILTGFGSAVNWLRRSLPPWSVEFATVQTRGRALR